MPWNLDILNFIHRDLLNVMAVNHKASLISRDGAKTGYMHVLKIIEANPRKYGAHCVLHTS